MKRISIIILVLMISHASFSQSGYWVYFTDKPEGEFDPYSYFDKHTIERRTSQGIPLVQFSDLPVSDNYVDQVSHLVDEIGYASRWFNAVAVEATALQLEKVRQLEFVLDIEPMMMQSLVAVADDYDTTMSFEKRKLLEQQLSAMGGGHFTERGIDGSGVRIAIFDAGFTGADISPAFEHIREEGRLIKTWDFKKNKEDVWHGNTHGTSVWSCIAGELNGKPMGLATGAEFLLARTEGRGEPYSEETNWVAALEWADKNGADVINSSLGYTYHRYFPEQMDGKTSTVSRAATLAARKGILVVNAAGNEGSGKWEYVGAPADADSILSVGGIDPKSGYHTSFSSYGPTVDGRLKPNVCAFGHVAAASKASIVKTQGTSFASPLTAGFAACAWQAFPDDNNMELLQRIERTASLYPYYDYAHGYGVPQAGLMLGVESHTSKELLNVEQKDSTFTISVDITSPPGFEYPASDYLFLHISNKDGLIRKYWVVDMEDAQEFSIPMDEVDDWEAGDVIRAYFRGCLATLVIKRDE